MKGQTNRGWRWAGSVGLFLLVLLAAAIATLVWIRRQQADPVASDAELAPPIERPVSRVRAGLRLEAGGLSGQVVDWGGRGIAGASVTAVRQRSSREAPAARTATSAGGGEFRFDGLLPGTYVVTATAAGFSRAFRDRLQVEPADTLEDVRLRLWAGGLTLSGRVLDAGGGVIAGAFVRASGYDLTDDGTHEARAFQTESDGDGNYRLQLPRGRHKLVAGADGYAEASEARELSMDTTKDFSLQPAAHIAGRVVTRDGQSVPGARVRALRGDGWRDALADAVTTDDLGRFLLEPLAPGNYRLHARADGFLGTLAEPIALESAERIDDVELIVAATVTVRGQVRTVSGKPVPHARVNLNPQARALRIGGPPPGGFADETGRYQIDDVVPGDYRLTVASPEYARNAAPLTITRSLEHDIVLTPAAVVTGVVLTAAGQPAARASVQGFLRASGAGGDSIMSQATADAQGRFSLGGLGAGQLTVTARHKLDAARAGPEPLDAGGRKDLTLRLAPGARVSGTVTWTDGTPVAVATVMTIAAAPEEYRSFRVETLTAQDGTFTLAGLPPGPISLRAAAPRANPVDVLRAGAGPGPEQTTLTLTAGESRTGVKLLVAR